jgi:hypothetical protein
VGEEEGTHLTVSVADCQWLPRRMCLCRFRSDEEPVWPRTANCSAGLLIDLLFILWTFVSSFVFAAVNGIVRRRRCQVSELPNSLPGA